LKIGSAAREAKNFVGSGPRALQNPGARLAKVFCAAFFQKSGCLLYNLTHAQTASMNARSAGAIWRCAG
jgi:hypothetical protein